MVSVNPYTDIGVFDESVAKRYSIEPRLLGSAPAPLAPHIFAAVAATLSEPRGSGRHALLISGESGAGKTETMRFGLVFLAARCFAAERVRDRLLHSNPVLEAFGNARIRQNGNSFRFGKFIEVHISSSREILGATLQPYMLESSRVAGSLPKFERTYHVFYQVRAALEVLLAGQSQPCDFWHSIASNPQWVELATTAGKLLATSPRLDEGPSREECLEGFESLHHKLLSMGATDDTVAAVARVVAAVAILADEDRVELDALLTAVEQFLGISQERFRMFLVCVESSAGPGGRERYVRNRSEAEARTLRQSVAQELYAALSSWVILIIF